MMNQEFDIDSVLEWVNYKIQTDMNLLRSNTLLTDSNIDIHNQIRSRMNAYIEVKSYIEWGKSGHK